MRDWRGEGGGGGLFFVFGFWFLVCLRNAVCVLFSCFLHFSSLFLPPSELKLSLSSSSHLHLLCFTFSAFSCSMGSHLLPTLVSLPWQTCSGDQTVTIYTLSSTGTWLLHPGCSWPAHKSAVWRLAWAHPSYGQLLATAGADQIVNVWEEQEGGHSAEQAGGGGRGGAAQPPATTPPATRWVQKAQLTEARKAVNCLQFAPRHCGLRLATGAADGVVRIYEAIDVMNLNHWPMSQCFDADVGPESELGVAALAWSGCSGSSEPPLLAVGGASGRVAVWQFEENNRSWGVAVELPRHPRGVLGKEEEEEGEEEEEEEERRMKRGREGSEAY